MGFAAIFYFAECLNTHLNRQFPRSTQIGNIYIVSGVISLETEETAFSLFAVSVTTHS